MGRSAMSNEQPQPRAVFGEILVDYLAQLGEAWEGIDFAVLGWNWMARLR